MAIDEKHIPHEDDSAPEMISASSPLSFEEALEKWEEDMTEVFEDSRAAEQLSAEDFAVRINVKA